MSLCVADWIPRLAAKPKPQNLALDNFITFIDYSEHSEYINFAQKNSDDPN